MKTEIKLEFGKKYELVFDYKSLLILKTKFILMLLLSVLCSFTIAQGTYVPDDNFRIAINEHLGYVYPETVNHDPTIAELNGITGTVNADGLNISSIEGAQYLSGLVSLNLGDNQIVDISPLSGLTNLLELNLYNNQIIDVTSLSTLTTLPKLNLSGNQIIDISSFSALTGLITLWSGQNQIIDISALSGLTNLTELGLDANHISDISMLTALSNLVSFGAGNNQINNIGVVSHFTNLTNLVMDNNQISDISSVSGLTNLVSLDLTGNQISDISSVSGLTNLKYLRLYVNQITDISAVSGLTELIILDLGWNQIEDISAVSGLTNLKSLRLEPDNVNDISAVSGLTNLEYLYLGFNEITDIYPILENAGLGVGDGLYLEHAMGDYFLSHEALNIHIPILQSRGFITLDYDPLPNNSAACYPIPARYENGVATNIQLEWQGNFESTDAVFEVWIGESAENLINLGIGTHKIDNTYTFTPSLNPNTDYFWRIRTITPNSALWSGMWKFNTDLPANISVNPSFLSESLLLDATSSQLLTIINDADGQLNWTINIEEIPEGNWVSADILSGTILPNSTQGINITFDANDLNVGDYTANININSNDPDEPIVTVPVALNVSDCTPPILMCPSDILIDNDEGQCGAIAFFEANVSGSPAPVVTYSSASGSFYPVGTTEVIVSAVNSCDIDNCSFFVTVEDNTVPVISTITSPITIWPPNHQYASFTISDFVLATSDNCSAISVDDVLISRVTSDEVEDANGGRDGNTINDIVIGDDCKSVQLRKERVGGGNGRVYTIYLSVDDGNGNSGTASCQVYVPKNNGGTAVDDGMAYEEICGSKSSSVVSLNYDTELKNYPNPFTRSTTIVFRLAEANYTELIVYNVHGNKVATLFEANAEANQVYKLQFNVMSLSPGMYFCKLQSGENINVMKKMFLIDNK